MNLRFTKGLMTDRHALNGGNGNPGEDKKPPGAHSEYPGRRPPRGQAFFSFRRALALIFRLSLRLFRLRSSSFLRSLFLCLLILFPFLILMAGEVPM